MELKRLRFHTYQQCDPVEVTQPFSAFSSVARDNNVHMVRLSGW